MEEPNVGDNVTFSVAFMKMQLCRHESNWEAFLDTSRLLGNVTSAQQEGLTRSSSSSYTSSPSSSEGLEIRAGTSAKCGSFRWAPETQPGWREKFGYLQIQI